MKLSLHFYAVILAKEYLDDKKLNEGPIQLGNNLNFHIL